MSRILVGTFPVAGHVTPFLPLVRALANRGHRVVWNCSEAFSPQIKAAGAEFAPIRYARDLSNFRREDLAPGGDRLTGIAALKVDLKYGFIDNAPKQLKDVREIAAWFRPHALLCDPGFIGGLLFHELTGVPLALLNILPMMLSSVDTAPNGMGLPPMPGAPGRVRNRLLNWSVEHVIFRDVQKHWNAVRVSLGLARTGWLMDAAARASVFMQASVPGFEYPRSDLPANVNFIGMLPVDPPLDWRPPVWWRELDGWRPVVHVTQGTLANSKPDLIRPALEGLAGEDCLVVVASGGPSARQLGIELPANARLAPFLSYPELLPRTEVMITNGGYGGTQMALAHGVPLVVAGTTEDKPEVAARVAWCGAGINLKTGTPSPEQVREAVRAVTREPQYRRQSRALQGEYARYNAVERATGIVEQLARQAASSSSKQTATLPQRPELISS